MNRLILVGSTRMNGRSAALADELFEACIEECPDEKVTCIHAAALDIQPCTACGACEALTAKAQEAWAAACEAAAKAESAGNDAGKAPCGKGKGKGGAQGQRSRGIDQLDPEAASVACCKDDDMIEVYRALDDADELIVVAPVYFSGPTSVLKAVLDRLQPFFHTQARHGDLRPATLHIIGEGHDPFGYDPLVTIVQSALFCAGFELQRIFDWVGCISADGAIVADAQEYALVADEDDGSEG